ncbi:MAG: hypothetical protein JWO08_2454, partial [Verrucomicrobiaceae bacterium]|nr:hypothetical protein [Verrucomicrobiaceae bacterium]
KGANLLLRSNDAVLQLNPDGTTSDTAPELPLPPDNREPTITVTKDDNGLVHLWRGEPGAMEAFDPLPHPSPVVTTALDSTNRYLATIAKDKTLRVWEIPTGLMVTPPLPLNSSDGRIVWDDSHLMLAVWTENEVVLFDW